MLALVNCQLEGNNWGIICYINLEMFLFFNFCVGISMNCFLINAIISDFNYDNLAMFIQIDALVSHSENNNVSCHCCPQRS